jgi:hypothetical protein
VKVLIAESSYPRDFYNRELDGNSVASLLSTICVEHELRYVLDFPHFEKAIKESIEKRCQIFHLSCHGDATGIALANNYQPTWDEFAQAFQQNEVAPPVLVMSSCCGAASQIGRAFEKQARRPKIIFGSTEPLNFSQYAVAWSILYHRFKTDGLVKSAARTALQHITATVHRSFVYRRWSGDQGKYLTYPASGLTYEVRELSS